MGTVLVERLPSEEFAPKAGLKYADVWGLLKLFDGLAFRSDLILVGPKGLGKTLAVQAFAAKVDSPIVTFDCSEDVRRGTLLGSFTIRGQDTPFILGPITTAVEVANEKGRCILVLEELSTLTPQAQKILNPLTDFRRRIEVPECKKVFGLRDGARLWVVGTMNTTSYGGVYSLNEDLKSRFRLLSLDYPTAEQEARIVEAQLGARVNQTFLKKLLVLAQETRQKSLEYALSPRDLVQIHEDANEVGPETALRLAVGKFEAEDQVTVTRRIESAFALRIQPFGRS